MNFCSRQTAAEELITTKLTLEFDFGKTFKSTESTGLHICAQQTCKYHQPASLSTYSAGFSGEGRYGGWFLQWPKKKKKKGASYPHSATQQWWSQTSFEVQCWDQQNCLLMSVKRLSHSALSHRWDLSCISHIPADSQLETIWMDTSHIKKNHEKNYETIQMHLCKLVPMLRYRAA